MTKAEVVEAVKAHALAHYNDGGWDVIVEAWSDEDIASAIGAARTLKGAIRKLAAVIDVYSERQADAVISAGEEQGRESYPVADVPVSYEAQLIADGRCPDLVWVDTEDGRVDGRCLAPITDTELGSCAYHAAERRQWLTQDEGERLAWEIAHEQTGDTALTRLDW